MGEEHDFAEGVTLSEVDCARDSSLPADMGELLDIADAVTLSEVEVRSCFFSGRTSHDFLILRPRSE